MCRGGAASTAEAAQAKAAQAEARPVCGVSGGEGAAAAQAKAARAQAAKAARAEAARAQRAEAKTARAEAARAEAARAEAAPAEAAVAARAEAARVQGSWSPAEDAQLARAALRGCRGRARVPWTLIAAEVEGRDANACRKRWGNQLYPQLNHGGVWSEAEDAARCCGWWHGTATSTPR